MFHHKYPSNDQNGRFPGFQKITEKTTISCSWFVQGDQRFGQEFPWFFFHGFSPLIFHHFPMKKHGSTGFPNRFHVVVMIMARQNHVHLRHFVGQQLVVRHTPWCKQRSWRDEIPQILANICIFYLYKYIHTRWFISKNNVYIYIERKTHTNVYYIYIYT